MIPGPSVMILLKQAIGIFGPPSEWDQRVVTQWLITTARALSQGQDVLEDIKERQARR